MIAAVFVLSASFTVLCVQKLESYNKQTLATVCHVLVFHSMKICCRYDITLEIVPQDAMTHLIVPSNVMR